MSGRLGRSGDGAGFVAHFASFWGELVLRGLSGFGSSVSEGGVAFADCPLSFVFFLLSLGGCGGESSGFRFAPGNRGFLENTCERASSVEGCSDDSASTERNTSVSSLKMDAIISSGV